MADDVVVKWWERPEVRERRQRQARFYEGTIEELHEQGKIVVTPAADRVLLRAILTLDGSELGQSLAYDARQAIAHEVVALGPGVRKWERDNGVERVEDGIQLGMHAFVVSAAADRLSKMDPTVRLWTARVSHLVAYWWPGERPSG